MSSQSSVPIDEPSLLSELHAIQARLDRLIAQVRHDLPARPSQLSVAGWCEKWPDVHRPAWPDKTRAHNLKMVRAFVAEHGETAMPRVSDLLARRWGKAHPGEVRYLRTFFNDAIAAGMIDRNPFHAAPVPKSSGRKAKDPPTREDVDLLAARALTMWPGKFGETIRAAILVAAYSGLRQAELLSLRASDVKYSKVWVRCGKGGKTRKVTVLADGREALRDICKMRPEGRLFRGKAGHPLSATRLKDAYIQVRTACGFSYSWHSLRHGHASWLLDAGASETDVAWQLHGTFDPTELRRTYAHPSDDKALDRLEGVL